MQHDQNTVYERHPALHALSVDELKLILEDALFAAVGWTGAAPAIYPIPVVLGGPNWIADIKELDERALGTVRNLQARYEVNTEQPPA